MARTPTTNPADLGGDDEAKPEASITETVETTTNPADLGGDELIACVSTGANGVVAGTIVHISPRDLDETVARGYVHPPVEADQD